MSANFYSRAKYRAFRRKSSSASVPVPLDDEIPLSEMDTTLQLHDSSEQDNDQGDQQVRSRPYLLCYLLHILLVILHIVLLVIVAFNHPEHRIVIPYATGEFTVGLSGSLQAFYTLYTTLLVFITQRLILSIVFCGPTKLTQIHDVCGAWCGLGAALSGLWQQTKVKSSVFAIALVMAYFTGISVLHIASTTIMEFQPFNATVASTVSAVAPWPNPMSEFTDYSLNWEDAVVSFSSYVQNLYGNTTPGLANNTLYDLPTPSFVNATVNATTVNSHCGLLTNLSIDTEMRNINVSMTGLDPMTFGVVNPPLPNEAWFIIPGVIPSFITFLVSATVEADDSVTGTSHVYINGTFSPPGSVAQNFTTRAYLIACSFDTIATTATLGTSSVQLGLEEQQTSATWPTFLPGGDANLSFAVAAAIWGTTFQLPNSPNCQPFMSDPYWQNMNIFDAYMISSLGIGLSPCNATSVEQYNGTPVILTRDRVENVTSQIAAQFVWLAGQLGKGGGGFNRQTEDAQIMEYVLKWRLNINVLPVIFSLCASAVLCILVVCMLWGQNTSRQAVTSAAGVLEIMWLGSRSAILHGHLRGVRDTSVDALRASSVFEMVLWTPLHNVYATYDGLDAAVSCYEVAGRTSPGTFGPEYAKNRQPDPHPKRHHRTRDTSGSRRWCYALHITLVALHIALILLSIRHPERLIVIPIETTVLTTGLSALLQAVYTIYSALLVFVIQSLSFSRMIGERRKLTAVHDVSGAWTGVGAATLVLWQQRKLASSPWEVLTVVIYLASMLVLHIASSSIMQWQAFNTNLLVSVLQSDLALPDSALNISQLGWSQISFIGTSAGQASNLSTYGLSGSTIYDIPQVPDNVTVSNVIVNATTFSTQCGLVPNVTLLSDHFDYSDPYVAFGQYPIGFSLNGSGNHTLLTPPLWKDILHKINATDQCTECPQTLFYAITAAIDVDESVHDPVALKLNWTYITSSVTNVHNSTTLTYIAACSVGARTIPSTLDIQEQKLVSTPNQTAVSTSTSWSLWSPAAATNLNVGMATALSQYYQAYEIVSSGNSSVFYTTSMDTYLMTLFGWNWTASENVAGLQSSADPSVLLTPGQLENVLSQSAATFMWVAGQLGESNGGFNRTVGQTQGFQDAVQYRLNINTMPVVFASAASFIALAMARVILGRKPDREHALSVSGMSVLESLWLEANSEVLHSRLQAVDELHSDKLREAGMFDICLGDVTGARSTGRSLEVFDSEEAGLNENPEE